MTWRRHARTVRATLALWAVGASSLATNAQVWVWHRRGAGARIPAGVHLIVGLEPDRPPDRRAPDVTIDLTAHEREHAMVGPPRR